jgi:hypothetical protein
MGGRVVTDNCADSNPNIEEKSAISSISCLKFAIKVASYELPVSRKDKTINHRVHREKIKRVYHS